MSEPEVRVTAGLLRAALATVPDDAEVVLYDPRLDRRLWLDHVEAAGPHVVLVAVKR